MVLSLQSEGLGSPQHLKQHGGLCPTHPGDSVTIETAAGSGWEDRGMWQPPNPPGAWGTVPPLPGSTQKTTGDPQTPPPCPPIGHPGLGRAAFPSHPPAPSGTPWNLPCPWMGVTGSVCQLCQALSSRAARSCQAALLLGAQTQNLKDCLDLLNVAAFVCFLPSVFQILRFLPSVLQIFRV